jgi:Secretion system C-terminal sorting domain
MKRLVQILYLFFLICFLSFQNIPAQPTCIISGPISVVTNLQVTYKTTIVNSNWEVYSYNGAQAQIIFSNYDSLQINTGPSIGNYRVYCLSNPGKDVLCSLNVVVDAALPVELNSFTSFVNGRNVTLNWSTSSEENNNGFEIQRAAENSDWSVLNFINGRGAENSNADYTFEDKNLNSGRYKYRLKQTDLNGNFRYYELQNEITIGIPEIFSISQNYPNPFNPVTRINYDIPQDGIVTIKIFDISGKEVASLINEYKSAGYYTISFDATSLSSGVYFYRLESGNFSAVKKMFLIK